MAHQTNFAPHGRGMTILELTAAIAIVGVVVAAFASIYTRMADQTIIAEASVEADALRTYLQGIVNQPELCSNALRDGAGNPIIWNFGAVAQANVATVRTTSTSPTAIVPVNGAVAITTGTPYSRYLFIRRMYLREPLGGFDESIPARSAILFNGRAYTTLAAKLIVEAQVRSSTSPTPLKPRAVDLVVGVDNATGSVDFCVQAQYTKTASNVVCNAANLTPPNVDCPVDAYCAPIYHFTGFQADGTPICACATSCFNGPFGPRGN